MSDWQPLENNSEVITKYMAEIGFDDSNFVFQDLLSFEDWAQEMIQQPVLGLLFIYAITQVQEKHRHAEEAIIAEKGQEVPADLFYMTQFAQNACGTVGCFHILGNLEGNHKSLVKAGSLLSTFYEKAQGKDKDEIGHLFNGSGELQQKHVSAVQEGSLNVEDHQNTNNHFIAFVQKNGHIFELDGRKQRAINHGPTTGESFLADACKVAQEFIARDPDNPNVGMIVLAPKPLED
jgi:ubiquitin carboxyl-terminal hydrolase L3